MGNKFMCMSKKDTRAVNGSKSKRMGRSSRKTMADEEFLHRQALSMTLQQVSQSQRFDGSISRRVGSTNTKRRMLSDPFTNGKEDINMCSDQLSHEEKMLQGLEFYDLSEFLETLHVKKFVLVHGEGFGAWCWYKTIALLEEAGLSATALDLMGSGINLMDINNVTTVAEYSKPLLDLLTNLPVDEKVILVGHSSGGACVSYALEHFPDKISKAIFLRATMVSDGQRPFDAFTEQLGSADLFMKESKFLIHGNGKDKPPTGFMFEKEQIKALYFNQSPTKDVALAMVSMRPTPLGPIMENLSLTPEKYGTARRFFNQTLDDRVLSPDVQEKLLRENAPERVFKIKGSDHCPFFSKPQSLHKILVEIAQIA